MKFTIQDRDGHLDEFRGKVFEFQTLEEFAKWAVQVELPRHTFVPPHFSSHYGWLYPPSNPTENWLVYCESDYD